jgi:hypothetical protein
MSVTGLRSYQYKWATALDEKLGQLVSQLEGDRLGQGHGSPQARLGLALELETLLELLDPLAENAKIDAAGALQIPVPVLRRLRATEIDGRSFKDALAATITRLREDGEPLRSEDLAVLHYLLEATSDEASQAFERVVNR